MKILITLIMIILTCGTVNAAEFHLDYIATVTPLHNENHVGASREIERFYLEIKPSVTIEVFDGFDLNYYVAIQNQGSQDWSREGMTYSADQWRTTIEHGGTFDLVGDKLQLYTRFSMPLDRHDWGGWYWWRVGFSGRLF